MAHAQKRAALDAKVRTQFNSNHTFLRKIYWCGHKILPKSIVSKRTIFQHFIQPFPGKKHSFEMYHNKVQNLNLALNKGTNR